MCSGEFDPAYIVFKSFFNMYVKHFYHEPLARETWATTPHAFDVK